ncbi:unnamed protein product [Rodentolepis nana]|uniref:EGF-like domain-containing protein n=1 Tax=Rodentolepis nana TaxID=102285 RepID=A0A0R3TYG8_RODNA|nr:unnamed protein product [Rodentolepis nana]
MFFEIVLMGLLLVTHSSGYHFHPTVQEPPLDVSFDGGRGFEPVKISKRISISNLSSEKIEAGLWKLYYEVANCIRPCLNHGETILPRNAIEYCRCLCPPTHFGLACEYQYISNPLSRSTQST